MTENKHHYAPVLICGMHRSGTSLFAQVLANCGLYLGEKEDFYEAHPMDNPEGFWEFKSIVSFSDQLLQKIGGAWDNPKPIQNGLWLDELEFENEQHAALNTLEPLMNAGKPWGWKDPRATIMLPFWKSIFPELSVIICLRNPIEVAYSLSKRYRTHIDFNLGLILWRDYYEILKRDLEGVNSLVTHYQTLFVTPEEEIERLCNFIHLSPSQDEKMKAIDSINPDLYRGVATEQLLQNFRDLPFGLLDLYQYFSNLSGKNFQVALENNNQNTDRNLFALEKTISSAAKTFDNYSNHIQDLKNQLEEQKSTFSAYKKEQNLLLSNLRTKLHQKTETVQNLSNKLDERKLTVQKLTSKIKENEKTIQGLNTQVRQSEQNIQGLTRQVQELEETNRGLKNQVSEQKQTIQNLNSQTHEYEKNIGIISRESSEQKQIINQITKEKSEVEQEVLFYASSKSWQITRPLRKLRKLLRGDKNV